ncbi:MAG: beta-ketoacyl synthase [Desulfotalea sp.]|nr:MAG: beta-ketoacyl synthase [Desulfotalea sp.]
MEGRLVAGVKQGVALVAGNISTCLGDLEATWAAMLAGQTGLVKRRIASCLTPYPLGLVAGYQGRLAGGARLQTFLAELLATVPPLPPQTQLFVATTKGAVDDLTRKPNGHDPALGQPWTLGESIKSTLQFTPDPVTVSGACASGSLAVIQAAMAIDSGRCQHALVVAVDLVSEFVLRGFDSLKALSVTSVKPFDQQRDGLALGDGGAWLVMSSAENLCGRRGPLGRLHRWGIGCDATHITAPCRKGSGLGRVFEQILEHPSGRPIIVGGINGHGTGTAYNDAMEMLVFDDKCGADTPFCSVKGALGHSLAAAGLIEIVLCLKSLEEMKLPPTVGLSCSAGGRANVSGSGTLPLTAPSIISCNSGFGGINAGVYLTTSE